MSKKVNYDFRSIVHGIPVGVVVEHYQSGQSGSFFEPPVESEADVAVTDRKGYPAKWLESKMTRQDWRRLEHEAIQHIEGQEPDYEDSMDYKESLPELPVL